MRTSPIYLICKSRTDQQAEGGEGSEFHRLTVGAPSSMHAPEGRGGLGHTGDIALARISLRVTGEFAQGR